MLDNKNNMMIYKHKTVKEYMIWWKERQRIRRNKRVSVNKAYVNSGFYKKDR